MEELYALKIKAIWKQFWSEHFSFWMICGYLFIEYVRPQSIIPALNFLPWAQVFILLALVGSIIDPKCKWVQDSAHKWMVCFFLIILLSSWQAFQPSISFARLDFFTTWLVIYFLIVNIVNTRERFFIFLFIFIVASFKISWSLALVWAKRGFSFTTWGLMGPPGFFQNSGELAIQMAVFFPIAFYIRDYLRPYVTRFVYLLMGLMPLTAMMTILGSSSRGGQIALLVQICLMFYRFILRPKVIAWTIVVSMLIMVLVPEEQKQRYTQAGNDRTSQQRLNYWQAGLEMANQHPFLGVGYFNFAPYFETFYSEKMLYPHAELPHNIFVQVGADMGYIALFIYLLLLYRCIKLPKSTRGADDFLVHMAKALRLAFIGFFIAGQFVSVVYYPFMWIHLSMLVSVTNILGREEAKRAPGVSMLAEDNVAGKRKSNFKSRTIKAR